MFWGLIMEPNKRYTQVVQRSFHISMAALDCSTEQNENVQVLVGINDKNFLLCNLNTTNAQQTPLDLNFQSGDKIAFMHSGSGYVHLTGYLVPEDDFDEMLDEAEEEVPELVSSDRKNLKRKSSDNEERKTKKKKLPTADLLDAFANDSDENDDSFVVENVEEESEEDDEDDDDEEADEEESEESDEEESDEESEESDEDEEEVEEPKQPEPKKTPKKEKKQKMQNGTVGSKKDKKKMESSPKKDNQESPKPSKKLDKQKKDKSKKQQNDQNSDKDTKKNVDKENKPGKKMVEGGVQIEDLKVGTGPIAKPGKFVQVYYEGRLKSSGKKFDTSKTGPGFKFQLGKKEVIQGWDIGVAGMRVGGKRRITCPPHMAYGAKGSPPAIPPNSTLIFEVELRSVN